MVLDYPWPISPYLHSKLKVDSCWNPVFRFFFFYLSIWGTQLNSVIHLSIYAVPMFPGVFFSMYIKSLILLQGTRSEQTHLSGLKNAHLFAESVMCPCVGGSGSCLFISGQSLVSRYSLIAHTQKWNLVSSSFTWEEKRARICFYSAVIISGIVSVWIIFFFLSVIPDSFLRTLYVAFLFMIRGQ